MSPGQPPDPQNLIDPGNRLLRIVPTDHTLDVGTMWAPGGTQLAVLTIRTADATVTIKLTPGQLKKNWVTLLDALAGSMSESGLAAGIPRLGTGLS